MKIKRRVFVGTSGWMYKHWGTKFYPPEIKGSEQLSYYAEHFRTLEVNTSFYNFVRESTFSKWQEKTPPDFLFSVKINRRYTHIKRMIIDSETEKSLEIFFRSLQKLKNKLAAVLIQLPESSRIKKERLEIFLGTCRRIITRLDHKPRLAVEFRHSSWFCEEIYSLLEKNKASLVIANSSRYPYVIRTTADFSYMRFHGPRELFLGKYSNVQLRSWKKKIDRLPQRVKTVFVYFNNDAAANAIENAAYFKKITSN